MNFDKSEKQDLLVKYRESRLTPVELERMKAWINVASTSEIGEILGDENPDEDVDGVDSETLARMKSRIDSQIRTDMKHDRRGLNIWKVMTAASAAVIALLIWVAGDFYKKSLMRHDDVMATVISTGIGERSTITLPDGTVVTLNSMSKLTFNSNIGTGAREVDFNGEAYFAVAKDSTRPFRINTGEMVVEVHGTSFSLLARPTSKNCELMLDNGSVRLVSAKTKRDVLLEPGEMALYNKEDGDFIVENFIEESPETPVGAGKTDEPALADASADIARTTVIPEWRFSGVEFDDVSPDSLVMTIENMYGVKLNPAITSAIDGNFTGSLPDADLYATLRILSRIYGFEMPFTVQE